VVVGGIVASGWLGLEVRGVKLLGEVPQGLPALGLPAIHWADWDELLPLAFACFLLGAVETAAIGRMFTAKHGGRLDANQEFLALAASNLAAGLGRGFPISGGMSQSLVNEGGGARTPLSGAFAAGIILMVILFFSHLLAALPQPVLAAVVLVAVASLFNVKALRELWHTDRPEFIVAVAAIIGVLGQGLLRGVMIQDVSNYYSANNSFYNAAKADEIITKLGALGIAETVTARVFAPNDILFIDIIRAAPTITVDVKAVGGATLGGVTHASVGIKDSPAGAVTLLAGVNANNGGNNKWTDALSTLYEFRPHARGQKSGTLTITQGVLGTDRVIINDFDLARAQLAGGFLGIHLGTLEVAVKPGATANPFDDQNFDEANAPTPTSVVADGDANSYTIFLPYAAGDGGQRIHLKLEGADADKLSIIANGETLTVVNGEFDVTITEGERALTFALLDAESVAADASLTLTATLADAEGTPTHQTHTELTLTLEAPEDPTTADQAFA
jgi:hypothetical protein